MSQPGLSTPSPATSGKQIVASAVGWGWGCMSILIGIVFLAVGPGAAQRMVGIAAISGGMLLLPPVVKRLRQRFALMRSTGVPAIIGMGVGFFLLGIALLMPAPPSTPSSSPEASPNRPTTMASAPAGPRLDIIAAGDELEPAQDALNRGEVVEAVQLFYSRDVPQSRRMSPEGKELKTAIQAAMDRTNGAEPGQWEARVFETAHSQLEALADFSPDAEIGQVWQRLAIFEDASRLLEEHPATPLSEDARVERRLLASTLSGRQSVDLPAMRKAYGEAMRRNLWEQDVSVAVTGGRTTTIGYTGVLFAANRNIAQVQRGALPSLQKLRFDRSRFRWSEGDDRWTFYDLEPPQDPEIGYWSNGKFIEVS